MIISKQLAKRALQDYRIHLYNFHWLTVAKKIVADKQCKLVTSEWLNYYKTWEGYEPPILDKQSTYEHGVTGELIIADDGLIYFNIEVWDCNNFSGRKDTQRCRFSMLLDDDTIPEQFHSIVTDRLIDIGKKEVEQEDNMIMEARIQARLQRICDEVEG